MLVLLALQAVSGPVLPAERPRTPDRPCPPAGQASDDVVVCGRRDDDAFRLKPPASRYERPGALPKAETHLFGNVKGAVETEAGGLPGGIPSNRLMFRLKIPM